MISFDELTIVLTQHFTPSPLPIAKLHRFHKRVQAPGETVATYVSELRRMAHCCDFGGNLRDRFACGLKNGDVIKKLPAEKDLDLPIKQHQEA